MPGTPTIDSELLRAFVTVVDTGGFSAAAQRLLRGQSAISLQVKRLEERLGARLLDRGPRHLSLTGEGEAILESARRILALNEELAARAREPEMAGMVRLGAPEDFATTRLPAILASFTRTFPRVALEVTCELTLELLDRFHGGGLDLALIKREPSGPDQGTRVWREPLVWVAAHHDAAVGDEPLPLICSPRPCLHRKRATSALDAIGRPWRIAYSCQSLSGNHAALRAGLGIAVLPLDMVPHDLVILNEGDNGLPNLADTEMALIAAATLSAPAQRLREYIVRDLEHGR
ncbi:LysR substrate-binding domain-containing protein [Sphingomonas arenae]|uniref:LysR substrate-binding domain-containing protein n=1 Tax=Sphingomonas arenae TaxID=2812555 RepID=UPI001967191F|nr:LysR substrate-binding domain-containing protein [Sphingomonas arenae]